MLAVIMRNTLNMIVTMQQLPLSEPLKGDEYRICIFIPAVLFAPYPDLTKCFCSQPYSLVSNTEIKKLKIISNRSNTTAKFAG